MSARTTLFLTALFGFISLGRAQDQAHLNIDSPFGSFVEEGFPFFGQTLDAREFGESPEPDNVTPRGIIVKIGHGYYGCFDPDLLRWSLIWRENDEGEYLKMDGMGPGSYRLPNRKAPSGQESLPKPIGTILTSTPALPGVGVDESALNKDPRERGISDEGEVGLGPIPETIGRFSGLQITTSESGGLGVAIKYTVLNTEISETLTALPKGGLFIRKLSIQPHSNPIYLRLSHRHKVRVEIGGIRRGLASDFIVIPPADRPQLVDIIYSDQDPNGAASASASASASATRLWPQTVESIIEPGTLEGTFTFDDIGLPVPNPWKRNVRLSGLDFFNDGRAAICTFDGDIWITESIEESHKTAIWSRFASGLHEPKTVCVVDDEIYVSDRNGITRLHDTDGNGEADFYENFSNVVAQTAETREFAMDMVATPDGGFIVAKGGQIGNTRGKLNGTIVKISPDGRSYNVIATGLRQPYIGLDPETGTLTSSDQQGHWKPATPIYRIEPEKYYGFQPAKFKENAVHPEPIAPPEIWIPHFINQSGASQIWMKGNANMGPLNGSLVHIGYNRPEIFKVFLNEENGQGAIVPLLSGFPSGLLKGAVHPKDGRLYLTGFEIWGSSGDRISGLFRVRPTGRTSWIPTQLLASRRGVLLEFNQPLAPELALDQSRYSVDRWNYQQTHNYGSGNFKLDGEPGQETVSVTSAKLSKDGKRLFLGLLDMKPCHSLRVTYRLPFPDNTAVESAYFSLWELPEIDLTTKGFADNEVDMIWDSPLTSTGERIEPSADLGKEVSIRYGCVACHATNESDTSPPPTTSGGIGAQIAVGPSWIKLWNSKREFTDGSFIKSADEIYLRESILDPGRRVTVGYETEKTGVGMPSYLGVLKDHEIDSILLYIKSLGKNRGK
tara:strand:- start:200 stop:2893 length:2694 start_codon:yes stop_codon:yes gene_type:complete